VESLTLRLGFLSGSTRFSAGVDTRRRLDAGVCGFDDERFVTVGWEAGVFAWMLSAGVLLEWVSATLSTTAGVFIGLLTSMLRV